MTNSQNTAEIARLRAAAPDYKESMEIGRDWDNTWKNMWPQEADVPGFKIFMLGFYRVSLPLPPAPFLNRLPRLKAQLIGMPRVARPCHACYRPRT